MKINPNSKNYTEKAILDFLNQLRDAKSLIDPKISDWWLNYLSMQEERYYDTFLFIQNTPKNTEILEVGCIPCQFHTLLKCFGYNIQGIDIAPERLKLFIEKYRLNIQKVDIENERFPFNDDSFGLILFNEVIEHLRLNPFNALKEIHRVLRRGGSLLLSTPNITYVHRLNFFLSCRSYQGNPIKIFEKVKNLGHIGHYRIYTFLELNEMLTYVGFKVNSVFYKGKPNIQNLRDRIILSLAPRKKLKKKTLYVEAIKI